MRVSEQDNLAQYIFGDYLALDLSSFIALCLGCFFYIVG